MTENNGKENGLRAKWGNEVFDDGVANYPACFALYGRRFVTPGEFSFIVNVLAYQYDSRLPYPSQETIAHNMGITVRQIGKWIESLEEKGFVEIYYRYNSKGERTSNEYSFKPLLDKCLEESRKEKAINEQGITKKKKKNKKKSTTCITGTDSEKTATCTSGTGSIPTSGTGSTPTSGTGTPRPQVQSNKVSEESKFEESKLNNVCVEEQHFLKLIESREDLNTHTDQLMILFKKLSKRKNFNPDVFLETLEIINLDVYDMNYLKAALNNNLKKGFVKDLAIKPKQPQSVRKEILPDWFNEDTKKRGQKKESKPKYTEEELAAKQKEIADLLANI